MNKKHLPAAPNPQGKGHVGFLLDWDRTRPKRVRAKKPVQLLADYFTSLLVLSSQFSIQPVTGQRYYLYFLRGQWSLSLVSAREWKSEERLTAFVGECRLHDDMTWSIAPADDLGDKAEISAALTTIFDQFVADLDNDEPLQHGLPFYAGALRYWQRLLASALSHSVRDSLIRSGLAEVASADILAEIENVRQILPLLAGADATNAQI